MKSGHVQLLRVTTTHAVDAMLEAEPGYRLDLSLSPRPQRAELRFPQRGSAARFEPAGRLFVVPPAEPVQARSERGEHRVLMCRLASAELPRRIDDRLLRASLNVSDGGLRHSLERLAAELEHPGFASTFLLELIAQQLALELGRYYGSLERSDTRRGLAAWRLRLIDERLRELHTAPSLDELAGLCRMSIRQLSRGFRQSRGQTLGDYVNQARLEHAKALLLDGKSVKEVAHLLGFGSSSAFCFAFRRDAGVSPLAYRDGVKTAADCSD